VAAQFFHANGRTDRYNEDCTLTEVFLTLTVVFLTLTEVFPCFFLSCKASARVKLSKTGHGPHSSKLVVICVVLSLFVLYYVFFFSVALRPNAGHGLLILEVL